MKKILPFILASTLLSSCYREPLDNWQGEINGNFVELNHPDGPKSFPEYLAITYSDSSKETFYYNNYKGLNMWSLQRNDTTYTKIRGGAYIVRVGNEQPQEKLINYSSYRSEFHNAEDRCEAWLDSIALRQ